MAQVFVNFTFLDPSGKPIANGVLKLNLNCDVSAAAVGGPQIAAGRTVTVPLDDTGSCGVFLYPNDVMVPAGSVYFGVVETANGQQVWSQQITISSDQNLLLQDDGQSVFLLDGSTASAITLD